MEENDAAENRLGICRASHATATVVPATAEGALATIKHSILAQWFRERFGWPSACQRLAWPRLAAGQSVLVTAPTGSGKTLAALLPIWDALLEHGPRAPALKALYLVPLKALAADVTTRLTTWFAEFAQFSNIPRLMVRQRTGDTSAHARRRLWEQPPDVLVTTPESLDLMLVDPAAKTAFAAVEWVVVDEAHDLASSKRGTGLTVALERLNSLARIRPRRIGLSATCSPAAAVAAWLGGPHHPVHVACAGHDPRFELQIKPLARGDDGHFMAQLLPELETLIRRHATTLVFTNTRGFTEHLAWRLRRHMPDLADKIGIHHGSLDRGNRSRTEEGILNSTLRAVVTSSSLELGIDLGHIDHVALVQPVGGTVRLLQRLGRSGHRPGQLRRGTIFTANPADAMEAVVARAAGETGWLEPLRIPEQPLDVLCQQLLGMSLAGNLTAAAAWELIRGTQPYRNLALGDFAAALSYLAGGVEGTMLPPRVVFADHRLQCIDRRTATMFRRNVGTIVDEFDVTVRGADDRPLGRVGLQFADRLKTGESFLLGGRSVTLQGRKAGELVVSSVSGRPLMTKWAGRLWPTAPAFIERLWSFRCRVRDALLEGPEHAAVLLRQEFGASGEIIRETLALFEAQETVSEIPADHLLVEAWPAEDASAWWYAVHLPMSARAGDGVVQVVARRLGGAPSLPSVSGPLVCCFAHSNEAPLEAACLRLLLLPAGLRDDLRASLASSPLLARRFTEVAHTGMMVLRRPMRTPRRVGGRHWVGERLLPWLRFTDPDSLLVRQAVAETLELEFSLDEIERVLAGFADRPLRLRLLSRPSPFTLAWLPEIDQTPAARAVSLEERLQQWHQEESDLASSVI